MAHFVQRHACRWAAKWHKRYKIKPDCQRGIPERNTRTLPRHSLLSKCHRVMRYTRKCYFIYAHKKSMPFPVYVVTKLKHARQHEVQTPCFQLQCHRAINVDGLWQPLGLQAVESSRIYTESTHEDGKAVSRTHRPPLFPRRYPWCSFLLKAESIPGP